ncbi:hypothetical protein COOONC_19566 [Cooperia oncophora]
MSYQLNSQQVHVGSREPPPPIIKPQPLPPPLPGPLPLPVAATPIPPPGPIHPPQMAQSPPPQGVAPLPHGIQPLPPAANPLLGRPLAPEPKSGSDRVLRPPPIPLAAPQPIPAPPQKPPPLVPPPKAASPQMLAPTPKLSPPAPKQVMPSPGPETPQNIASPAPQGGTPVGAAVGRSAPNTPIGGTPAVSARSVQAVEFIPATEYVDVSRVWIRLLQLLLLCELLFHLVAVSSGIELAELFSVFKKTLTNQTSTAALVAPVALALAAILTIRTIYGAFAIKIKSLNADLVLCAKQMLAELKEWQRNVEAKTGTRQPNYGRQ